MQNFLKVYHFLHYFLAVILFITAFIGIFPRIFGISPYIVLSGSMEPSIPTGSLVYINDTIDPYAIHTGDIITYELSGSNVTHRVISETITSVTTKGDANSEKDFSPVARTAILGKYLFSIPYLGYVYSYISNPYLFLVLTSLYGVDLIISLTNHFFNSKKEEPT